MEKIKKTKLSKKQLSQAKGGRANWCPDNHHLDKYGECLPNYTKDETMPKRRDRRD